MIAALEVSRDVDLALFSAFLRQQGVMHRIAEAGDQQVVWVSGEREVAYVQDLYARLARGEFSLEKSASSGAGAPPAWRGGGRFEALPLREQLKRVPLTVALIVVNLMFFPVTFGLDEGDISGLMQAMTFVPFEVRGEYVYFATLEQALDAGEYWRLLSPMFLHFGLLHIVFNLLWVWEIGRRIEAMSGVFVLLPLVLVSSLTANVAQYWMSGPSLFGGMSGVVFGLLGYALVWRQLLPHRDLGLPTGIYIFMLGFLALGFTGVFDFLLPGTLANAAHLGGLVGGLAIGAIAAGLARLSK